MEEVLYTRTTQTIDYFIDVCNIFIEVYYSGLQTYSYRIWDLKEDSIIEESKDFYNDWKTALNEALNQAYESTKQ